MKDFKVNGMVVEVELENGKTIKIDKKWVENSMVQLETDMEDVVLMYLEDNDYLVNDDQAELDLYAKENKVKVNAGDKAKKKTPRERVQKENPTKELIISTIAKALENLNVQDLNIENKGKLITFSMNNEEFKVDLVQKRKKKE